MAGKSFFGDPGKTAKDPVSGDQVGDLLKSAVSKLGLEKLLGQDEIPLELLSELVEGLKKILSSGALKPTEETDVLAVVENVDATPDEKGKWGFIKEYLSEAKNPEAIKSAAEKVSPALLKLLGA